MPTPSKFTHRHRLRVLEVLTAGGSRAEAARAAGIDGATLHRWIARGRTAHPGGRWFAFAAAVAQAEAGSPALVALQNLQARWEAHPLEALRFLDELGEFTPEPIVVEVKHSAVVAGSDDAS